MFHSFFKKRRVRCPDGRTIDVFTHPDHAMPFFVQALHVEAKGSLALTESLKASGAAGYNEQITGISKLVASESEKSLVEFRLIYQFYSESPCSREIWFQRRLDALLEERWRFSDARLQLETIVQLFKKGANANEILTAFREVSSRLTRPALASQLADEVKNAALLVGRWRAG